MSAYPARFLRFSVGLLGLVTLGWVLTVQAAKPVRHHTSLVTDWSHRHLIFSQPATDEALRFASEDPRYQQQQYRHLPRFLLSAKAGDGERESSQNHWWHWRHRKFHRDWAEDLGLGASMGPTNFPAKFSFDITQATCASDPSPDFVIFPTGLASSRTQASIVAYDNLYSGCGGTKPQVYWAYDTGGQVLTSPTYSLDGSQVAFVQTSGGVGTLVLLKWAPSSSESVTGPMPLTPIANSDYLTCSAPCMTTLNLQNGTNDTSSSIFYDYTNDIGWVGGTGGYLHKFAGLFKGTPSEVLTGGFPALLNSGASLGNPVYDHQSLSVFVEDTDGFLYNVNATSASVTKSAQLDFGGAITDGPLVDPIAQEVYLPASSDGSTSCLGNASCAVVYELNTSFSAGASGSKVVVGSSIVNGAGTPNALYSGDFDTAYLTSRANGNFYICGNTGGPPILYQVPISGATMGTAIPGPPLSNSTTPCSPVTDIQNPNATGGATEWIFVGARLNGTSNGCAHNGCLFNFKVTPWQPSTTYPQNVEILDSNFHIEAAATTNGVSGATAPVWNTTTSKATIDGTVRWVNQGSLSSSVFTPGGWQTGFAYTKGTIILDSNNNIEYCNVAGTSGGAVPTFLPNAGGITVDGSVHWKNLGKLPTAALPATGGTTGIIMDNIVSTGTLTGASQVYFSTLGNQTCATSGTTGGCAVQASQPALQ